MAFGRLERTPAARPMSEINMTPLIDVMLVLLVIFIVGAPLLASALRLDLPRAEAAAPGRAGAVLAVELDAEGRLTLAGEAATPQALSEAARAAAARDASTEVQLRADRRVPYGRVAEVLGLVQAAGLVRIGFVTEGPAGPIPVPAPGPVPAR
jgi:biopolymer transport protein ExbD